MSPFIEDFNSIVERWKPWFRTAIQEILPSFPLDILYDIESEDERVQATASLPAFNEYDQCEF
jgi:hypothetical protein